MGKVYKFSAWVPCVLNEQIKINVKRGLFARQKSTQGHRESFLYRIITGDEN